MTDSSDPRSGADQVVSRLAVEIAKLEVDVLGGELADTAGVQTLLQQLGALHRPESGPALDARSERLLSGLIVDLDRMIQKVERELRELRRGESEQATLAVAQMAYARNAVR
jgi:hypothetical protein